MVLRLIVMDDRQNTPSGPEPRWRIDEPARLKPNLLGTFAAYLELYELASPDRFEPATILSWLDSQPRIRARLMRVVNSSERGLRRKIVNLRHAILILGASGLRDFCSPYLQLRTESDSPARRRIDEPSAPTSLRPPANSSLRDTHPPLQPPSTTPSTTQ
jgi:hypothetical protein